MPSYSSPTLTLGLGEGKKTRCKSESKGKGKRKMQDSVVRVEEYLILLIKAFMRRSTPHQYDR